MQIIVSDVTRLGHKDVCVAGWDEQAARMVRPLAAVGKHWPLAMADSRLVHAGAIIEFEPATVHNDRGTPHATEDLVVSGSLRRIGSIPIAALPGQLAGSVSSSVAEIFSGKLMDNRVPAGADCSSLGAVEVNAARMGFDVRAWDGDQKMRCWFYDSANQRYSFAVSALDLNADFHSRGLDAVMRRKQRFRRCHLRIGLTHPYEDGLCVPMVNGAYFY